MERCPTCYGVNDGQSRGRQATMWDNPVHRLDIRPGRHATEWDRYGIDNDGFRGRRTTAWDNPVHMFNDQPYTAPVYITPPNSHQFTHRNWQQMVQPSYPPTNSTRQVRTQPPPQHPRPNSWYPLPPQPYSGYSIEMNGQSTISNIESFAIICEYQEVDQSGITGDEVAEKNGRGIIQRGRGAL